MYNVSGYFFYFFPFFRQKVNNLKLKNNIESGLTVATYACIVTLGVFCESALNILSVSRDFQVSKRTMKSMIVLLSIHLLLTFLCYDNLYRDSFLSTIENICPAWIIDNVYGIFRERFVS